MTEGYGDVKELPKGWHRIKLGEIVEFEYGKSLTKSLRNENGVFPVFGSSGIVGYHDEFLVNAPVLIVGRKGAVGEVWFSEKDCWAIDTTYFIKVSAFLSAKFIFLLLKSLRLRQYDKSTAIPGLNRNDAYRLNVAIPPFSEQERIVEKIEELFSDVDQGVESLKTAQKQLKVYRQAVLKWAFEGKLTEAWRKQHSSTLKTGEALLTQIKAERENRYQQQLAEWETAVKEWEAIGKVGKKPAKPQKPKELSTLTEADLSELSQLPDSWVWIRIGIVTECLDSMRIPINKKEREKRHGDIPYYGANGRVGWIDDHLFDEPLVLVVEDETFTGREKPFSYKISGKSWVNNHAHILRSEKNLDINYLNYQLFYYPFTALTTGTTGRKKLTQDALINAPIKFCSIEEQEQIVEEIELRLSTCDQLEATIIENLQKAEALRQSILKQAFEGKLVPQDPNDEPAEKLLERIKADREATRSLKPSKQLEIKGT